MSAMVERVARALAACDNSDWRAWVDDARAAIEAMREPTDQMVEAAYAAASLDDAWHIEDADHWKASWRAALLAGAK